ncbi:hypothetical protein K7432_000177 [Basidiobolus ranarum]|uniref:Uncharacterized protein n=1 Tax=Basidiobolus ranarum TaxID=34480 RepID=A0ABR2X509_9FUNG
MKVFKSVALATIILSFIATTQGQATAVPSKDAPKEDVKPANPVSEKPDPKVTPPAASLPPVAPTQEPTKPEPVPTKVEPTHETPKPEPTKVDPPKIETPAPTPTPTPTKEVVKPEQPKTPEPAKPTPTPQPNTPPTVQPTPQQIATTVQTVVVGKSNAPAYTNGPSKPSSIPTNSPDANAASANNGNSSNSTSGGGANVGAIVGGVFGGFVVLSAVGAFVYRKVARRSWREYNDEEYITTTSQESLHANNNMAYAQPASNMQNTHQGPDPFKNTLDQYHRGHHF